MMDKCLINYEVLYGFEKQYIKSCNYMRKYLKFKFKKIFKVRKILQIHSNFENKYKNIVHNFNCLNCIHRKNWNDEYQNVNIVLF